MGETGKRVEKRCEEIGPAYSVCCLICWQYSFPDTAITIKPSLQAREKRRSSIWRRISTQFSSSVSLTYFVYISHKKRIILNFDIHVVKIILTFFLSLKRHSCIIIFTDMCNIFLQAIAPHFIHIQITLCEKIKSYFGSFLQKRF